MFSVTLTSVALPGRDPTVLRHGRLAGGRTAPRTHGDLVNLSAGQPGAGAPAAVLAAAAAALQPKQLGYSVALGIPELRAEIARSYAPPYGIASTSTMSC